MYLLVEIMKKIKLSIPKNFKIKTKIKNIFTKKKLKKDIKSIQGDIESVAQQAHEEAKVLLDDAKELKDDVSAAKKSSRSIKINSIKYKLIGGFAIPILLMIVLGILSYRTAASAIISNYEEATGSTINATAEYYSLMFDNLESLSREMITNEGAKNYYSKMYKANITEEGNAYNTAKKYYQALVISNDAINNIYLITDYGNPIFTSTLTDTKIYDEFVKSDEAKNIDDNKMVWVTKREFLDNYMKAPYGVSLERQFYSNSTKPIGYLVLDIDESVITGPINKLDIGEGSIVALIAPDGGEFNNSGEDITYFSGTDFLTELSENQEKVSGYEYVNNGNQLFIYSKLDSGYIVCALVPKGVITAQARSIMVTTVIIVVAAMIVCFAIGGVLSLGISTSIHVIMKKLEAVAEGDLTTHVKVRRKDEFNTLAGSINNMIGKTKSMVENSADISKKVENSVDQVSGNAQILLDATKNITQAIEGIEQGIIQQASDSEECMKQMDVLADKIALVADNAETIKKVAEEAREVVRDGLLSIDELNEKAKDTVEVTGSIIEGITSLEESSKKISSIISAINEIADQTSLLSLNASIEAARAGDAGRGFAVVADEIRKLAEQSSESANQIKEIVDDIAGKTRETVEIARKAEEIVNSQGQSLENTVDVFNRIESQVGGLANNIGGIHTSVMDIDTAKNATLVSIQSISAVSQQTAASVEEVTATAERQLEAVEGLNDEAKELAGNADNLVKTIDAFKI